MGELGPASPRAVRTIERARDHARQHGQDNVGAEHIFLALLEDSNGIPNQVLSEFTDVAAVRRRLVGLLESEAYRTPTTRTLGGSSD